MARDWRDDKPAGTVKLLCPGLKPARKLVNVE